MKTPVDTVTGKITGIDERTGTVTIKAHYDDWFTLIKRQYKECWVEMKDSRPLSDKQRKMCHALMNEIADWSGSERALMKEQLKLDFIIGELGETAERLFSLSNAPMSLVCAFQKFLVHLILEYDIPTKRPLLEYVEDVTDYVYSCLVNKKCVVCGKTAELHHVERVGMGRSRDEIIHEGMECLSLCREHHTEAHTVPDDEFFQKYHIDKGIELDKTLCRIYRLKARKA